MRELLALLLFLSPLFLFVCFWGYALRRNWRSVRLLAISVTLSLILFIAILGLGAHNGAVLRGGIAVSLVIGASILCWPVAAPEVMKKLNFRW